MTKPSRWFIVLAWALVLFYPVPSVAAPDKAAEWIGFGAGVRTTQIRDLSSYVSASYPGKPIAEMIRLESGDLVDCHGGWIVYSGQGGFMIADQSNIVIRNCRFASTLTQVPTQIGGVPVHETVSHCRDAVLPREVFGCGVAIMIKGQARDIYIVNNDFTKCGEKCIAMGTEGLAPHLPDGSTPAPDMITIRLNKLTNSYFGIVAMVQKGISEAGMPHPIRVSVVDNLFDGVFRRAARGQGESVLIDETNNVIRNWTWPGSNCGGGRGFGPSSLGSAQLLLRANVFDASGGACPEVTNISDYVATDGSHRGMGSIRFDPAHPDLLLNNAARQESQPESVTFAPPDYPVLDASAVEAFVSAHAGAHE